MAPKDFLRAVWPDAGPYCIAYQMQFKSDPTRKFWKHAVVDSIDEALQVANELSHQYDMYFAVLSLKQREMYDDRRDAMVIRVHANMCASKAHIFDIDVGEGKDYPTQREALLALKQWLQQTGLPAPAVVSSGGGLHIYWLQETAVPADVWREYGTYLQQLADHYDLKTDRTCSSDPSRILRVPGTFNRKQTGNPRPVKILTGGVVTEPDIFQRAVRDALTTAGVAGQHLAPKQRVSEWGESNLTTEFQGTPPTLLEVAAVCAQVQEMIRLRGNLDQSAWYMAHLNTIKWCEDGENLCHKSSMGHPSYSAAETTAKLRQLDSYAPASCATIAKYMPDRGAACVGCRFANDPAVPNPIVAARRTTMAPEPVITAVVAGESVTQTTIPNPPAPYSRLKTGGISRKGKNADGDDVVEVIYPYDLYPVRRLTNPETGVEQQLWCVELPISGSKEFVVEAHALYDTRKFTETIAHQGIYPSKNNVPYLQDYMVAYISELQKLIAADTQAGHLGWIDDYTKFVLPDCVLTDDGSVKPAMLTTGAQVSASHVRSAGTLERQVELLKFYMDKRYIPHQVFILSGLGSTLLHMTNQHGLIVNASGPAGASKSTALYTAGSLWGEPEQYALNGTNEGATTKGRNERITTMANLPVCVDEITHMPVKAAQDLAMFVTQPTGRLRLRSDGVERRTGSEYKSTIMLTTANSSLHGLLSSDNAAGTAGSMRVFEIEFRLAGVHEKADADRFLRELKRNFGHIGPAFAAYVVQNHAAVTEKVHTVMQEMDELLKIEASERFWSAEVAVVLVAAEIAKSLGLLHFDVENIRHWLIDVQLPHMRGIVREEYNEPIAILTNYLETISGNILFVEHTEFSGKSEPFVRHKPYGSLLAHYDIQAGQMFVLKDGFKRYCVKIGASMHKVLQDLSTPRRDSLGNPLKVIPQRTVRKTLGAGTEYAKTQSYCFVIDMKHPDVGEGPRPKPVISTERQSDLLLAITGNPEDP